MRACVFFATIVLCSLNRVAVAAYAGDFYVSNTLGVFAVKSVAASVQTQAMSLPLDEDVSADFDSDFDLGMFAGYAASSWLFIEGGASIGRGDFGISMPFYSSDSFLKAKFSATRVRLGGRLELLPKYDINPYVSGYGHMANINLSRGSIGSNTTSFDSINSASFGYGFGFGLDLLLKTGFHIYSGYDIYVSKDVDISLPSEEDLVLTSGVEDQQQIQVKKGSSIQIVMKDDLVYHSFFLGFRFDL